MRRRALAGSLALAVGMWAFPAPDGEAAAQVPPDPAPPVGGMVVSPGNPLGSSSALGSRSIGRGVAGLPEEEPAVSPGRAFLRSLVVPGWGHAAVGSYTRGGSYFLLQGATIWMLYKSAEKRASARRERDLHYSLAESRARAAGIQDPDTIRMMAEGDERVEDFEELVETRGEQVEDWAALGIFLMLMGAADAFVSAHLQDFPEPLSRVDVVPWVASTPGLAGGSLRRAVGVDVGIRLPLGGRAGERP